MQQAFFRDKVIELEALATVLKSLKNVNNRKKIVFTTGAFDMLHPGHVSYLWRASEHGVYLIVGIDSDARVKAAKGNHRPIIQQDDRAAVVAGLACVDFVFIFDDMKTTLDIIQPDAMVVSPTSNEDMVFDRMAYAKSIGAEIITIAEQSHKHTTDYLMEILTNFSVLDRSPDT